MTYTHFQSPTDVLISWAKRQMEETKQPLTKFSEELTASYLRITPEGRRICPLDEVPRDATADEYYAICKKNALAVERWVKGVIKLPLEILDAWIETLHGMYRAGCLSELLGRHHITAVPEVNRADLASFVTTMRTTTDMIAALGNIMADSVIDENDHDQIIRARQQMWILKGQMGGWEQEFDRVLTSIAGSKL